MIGVKGKWKRSIAVILSAAMLLTMLPQGSMTAYAQEAGQSESTEETAVNGETAAQESMTEETGDTEETDDGEEAGDTKETDDGEEAGDTEETDDGETAGDTEETDDGEEAGDTEETDDGEEAGDTEETDDGETAGDTAEEGIEKEAEADEETTYEVVFRYISEQVEISNVMIDDASTSLSENTIRVPAGGSVAFKASAQTNYVIESVSAGETTLTMNEETELYTIENISSEMTVTIASAKEQYEVAFSYKKEEAQVSYQLAQGADTGLPESGKLTVESGTELKFKVTPEEFYEVTGVSYGGAAVSEEDYFILEEEEGFYTLTVTENFTVNIETGQQEDVKTIKVVCNEKYGENEPYLIIDKKIVKAGESILTDKSQVEVECCTIEGYELACIAKEGMYYAGSPDDKDQYSFHESYKTGILEIVEVRSQFVLCNRASDSSVVSIEGAALKSGCASTYLIDKDNADKEVKLTLETAKNSFRTPKVTLYEAGEEDSEESEGVEITPSATKTAGNKLRYTYTISAKNLKTTADNEENPSEIVISETEQEQKLTVSYDEKEADLVITADGRQLSCLEDQEDDKEEETKNQHTFFVRKNAKVEMTVSAKEGYQLTLAKDEARNKSIQIKNNSITYRMTADKDTSITVESEEVYYLQSLQDQTGKDTEKNKGVYYAEVGKSYVPVLYKGDSKVSVSKADVKIGKKSANSCGAENNGGAFSLQIAEEDAGKTLTVTLYEGEEQAVTFQMYVRPLAAKIQVAGVKNGKLIQETDCEKSYTIKVSTKNADNYFKASTEGAVSADVDGNQLVINTAKLKVGETAKVTIQAWNGTEYAAVKDGGTITVEASAVKLSKPAVKLVSSDDVSLTLSLSSKNVADRSGKIFYKLTVEPSGSEVPDSIKKAVNEPFYLERRADTQQAKITVNSAEFGTGEKWSFTVKAQLIYTETAVNTDDNGLAKAKDITEAAGGKEAVLKNASTKKPYYEMNLKVKQNSKAKTLYTGQQDVVLGTVQFSKNTTFTNFTVEDTMSLDEEKLNVRVENGNQIVASVPKYDPYKGIYPTGTHTIRITAAVPEGAKAATAEFTVNVVMSIQSIQTQPSNGIIYKPYQKASSMNLDMNFNSYLPDPDSEKVTYTILDYYGNEVTAGHRLYGMVSVKNGVITVDKNYVVSSDEEENQFNVKVTAADYEGNNTKGETGNIIISSQGKTLKEVVVVKYDYDNYTYRILARNGGEVSVKDLESAELVGVSEIKETYSWSDFIKITAKANSKKVSLVNWYGAVYFEDVSAAKNLTFTATTIDGSGQSAKLKLNVVYEKENDLGFEITGLSENSQLVNFDSESRQIDYAGTYGREVIFKLMDGNEQANPSAYNCKIQVKGATIIFSYNGFYAMILDKQDAQIILTDNSRTKDKKLTVTLHNTRKEADEVKVSAESTLKGGYCYYSGVGEEGRDKCPYLKFTVDKKYAGDKLAVYYTGADYKKNSWGYWYFSDNGLVFGEPDESDESDESDEPYIIAADGTVTIPMKKDYEENEKGRWNFSTYVEPGTYKFAVTVISKDESTGAELMHKPSTVTIKVNKVSNPSFQPASTYQIKQENGAEVILPKAADAEYCHYGELEPTGETNTYTRKYVMKNAVIDGEANHFTDYFELVYDEENKTYSIKVKKDADLTKCTTRDMTGYLSYGVCWYQPLYSKEGTIKVTMKWKK